MLTFKPTNKNPDVDSKIIQINMQMSEVLSFILNKPDYLDSCDSPSSVLEITRKFLSSSEEIQCTFKTRWFFSKVKSEFKDGKIQFNKKFINAKSPLYYIAGNLAHESGHFFGFGHTYEWNAKRKYNAVYYFGYLVEYLFECKLHGNIPLSKDFKNRMESIV